MNKKTITALSIGAAAVIGVAVFGCDGFSFNKEDIRAGSAADSDRRADGAYDDGVYDFYFKNGAHIGGYDCDGYKSEPGGSTFIYEWYQSEINKWEKRLLNAGVKPEVYRTSKLEHCWVRFDTDLLYGVGYEGYDDWNAVYNDGADVLLKGGTKKTYIPDLYLLCYASAHEGFNIAERKNGSKELLSKINETQKGRNISAILFVFSSDEGFKKAETRIEGAGISIVEKDNREEPDPYIIVNANDIPWFAYTEG